VAGEIFAELVGLGKETLQDDTEAGKNVSAVLIAAAFEDLIRRMGSELAAVVGRPKLEEVLTHRLAAAGYGRQSKAICREARERVILCKKIVEIGV